MLSSLLLLALHSATGCRTAPPAQDGTAEDFGRMVAEGGAEPVVGTEAEGQITLAPEDPVGMDPELAAELWEEDDEEFYGPPENPYIRFGERIVVKDYDDGLQIITKPFPLPPGKAGRILELVAALAPFPLSQRPLPTPEVPEPPRTPAGVVEYLLLENWDQEYYADLAAKVPTQANPITLSDVLVVSAEAELLADFENFIDLFSAGVPQIELEAKIIEIAETDSLDVGVRPVLDASGNPVPQFQFGGSNFVTGFGFDLPNAADATEALLTLGAVQDGTIFNAVIEAIQQWQNVTIETRPKTVVRAGGLARLESTVDFPFIDVKTLNDAGSFTSGVAYKSTGVKLYITPRVIGSKALALDVQLENSQVVRFQTIFSNDSGDVSVPVIANRTARTIVYLEPGQTLLIGGLTQETNQDAVNKIPILGDIPILGNLFRSTFKETRREHVIFAISPRIIQRGDLSAIF